MTADRGLVRPDGSGLACAAGRFWIDPWRPVRDAVVTHAHADHARPGSRRYYAAADGIELLRRRLGEDADLVGVPYGEPFRLGDTELTFHPAGHVLGSAQVCVDDGATRVCVTGDFKRAADPTCRPFEPVACDVLITEATFALPVYRWPPGHEVVAEIRDWHAECRAEGRSAVLFCYALGKAQRVLAELHALGFAETVWVHGALAPLIEVYRTAGVTMPPTCRVSDAADDADFTGSLVLAPPSARGTTWLRRFQPLSTGFASGWMRVRGNRRRRSVDRGFVLSDHADWPDLLRTVDDARARVVFATHGQSDVLARYLQESRDGLTAHVLETAFEGEVDD